MNYTRSNIVTGIPKKMLNMESLFTSFSIIQSSIAMPLSEFIFVQSWAILLFISSLLIRLLYTIVVFGCKSLSTECFVVCFSSLRSVWHSKRRHRLRVQMMSMGSERIKSRSLHFLLYLYLLHSMLVGVFIEFTDCVETMFHIVDAISDRYDITIGIFDDLEYATWGENRKYPVY